MSIRAMNWAMEQATGDPRAQCLLYVVSDAANEDGIAWPSADWMAKKSQQSRATVYRRLTQLQELGLLVLFPRYIDSDGKIWNAGAGGRRRTSPEIRLQFGVFIKQNDISADEGEDVESDEPPSQPETGPSHSGDTPVSLQRQGSSHCGDSKKNPHLNQEESPPNPPSGGGASDEEFDQFKESYPIPIINVPRTRRLLAALTPAERAACIQGAAGYARFCKAEKRRAKDAHFWVRDRKWEGFVGKDIPGSARPKVFVESGSEAWNAWIVFEACYGRSLMSPTHSAEHGNREGWWFESEYPPFGRGLDHHTFQWTAIPQGSQQWWAWQERLKEYRGVGSPSRLTMVDGNQVQAWKFPCEWPPAKGQAATGPPHAA